VLACSFFVSAIHIKPDGSLITETGIAMTVFGRTAIADPGTYQRIVEAVGQIDLSSGKLGQTVILSGVVQGEIISDGISGYDPNTNQIFFASDGAFGGTVFFADMTSITRLPPMSYYLSPVVFLGYDPVTKSRLISGVNTPGHNFLIMEQANWGEVSYFEAPSTVLPSANDAFDGAKRNYYNVYCRGFGSCQLTIWALQPNTTSSFPLSCVTGVISGPIFVNPLDTNTLIAIQFSAQDDYNVVSIDLQAKSCTLSRVLPGLPSKPRIIVALEVASISGYLVVSITSNQYNAILVYDTRFNLVSTVKTQELFEDIFVRES
jgi:hypothetical protein